LDFWGFRFFCKNLKV